MADEEDITTPPAVSWRAILTGTGTLPSGKKADPSDPALQLWRGWRANRTQVVALTRESQTMETHLIRTVGFPRLEIRLAGEDAPRVVVSIEAIEKLLADAPEAERRAQIAAFEAHQKRWDEAAAALGFGTVEAALQAALDRESGFTDSLSKTRAASLPGVAAKLAIILQLGEPSRKHPEFPWHELRSALADLARLAAPEAGAGAS